MEINEKAKVSLEIDDSEATTRFQEINTRLKEIKGSLKDIEQGSDAWKALKVEQQGLNSEMKELKHNIDVNDASMNELRAALSHWTKEANNAKAGTDEWVEASKKISEIKGRIGDITEEQKALGKVVDEQAKEGGMWSNFKSQAMAVFTGGALLDGAKALGQAMFEFGKEIFEITAKFEKYDTILTTALGSQEKAGKAMADIKKFAAETPFSVDELTESYIKYVNRGLQPSMAEMTKLGDIASSQGKSFEQLTEAVLDAGTGEFERLKEFGIQASKSGEQVEFSFKGVQKTVANTPEAIQGAILAFGELQGVAGGMDAISGTLTGRVSNLGDKFDALKLTIGEYLMPVFNFLLEAFSIGLDKIGELFLWFGKVGEQSSSLGMIWETVSGIVRVLFSALGSVVDIGIQLFSTIMSIASSFFDLSGAGSRTNLMLEALSFALKVVASVLIGALSGVQILADGLNILMNKGKELANFFGADFKIDPKANFDTLQKNAEKNFGSIKELWQESAKTGVKAQVDANVETEIKHKESKEKISAEAKKAAEKDASEKKKAESDALRNIEDMQIRAIANEDSRKIAEISVQARRQEDAIKKSLASEATKHSQLLLLEKETEDKIEKVQDDARKKKEKAEEDTIKKIAKWAVDSETDLTKKKKIEIELRAKTELDEAKKMLNNKEITLRQFVVREKQIKDKLITDIDAVEKKARNDKAAAEQKERDDKLKKDKIMLDNGFKAAIEQAKLDLSLTNSTAQAQFDAKMNLAKLEFDRKKALLELEAEANREKVRKTIVNENEQKTEIERIDTELKTNIKKADDKLQADKVKAQKESNEIRQKNNQEFYGALNKAMSGDLGDMLKFLQSKNTAEEGSLASRLQANMQHIEGVGNAMLAGVNALTKLNDDYTKKKLDNLTKEKNENIAKLEADFQAGKLTADELTKEKDRANKEYDAKEKELKREAFERNKKLQIASALIAGSMAILSALATPPFPLGLAMAVIAGVKTAIDINNIKKTNFEGRSGGVFRNAGVAQGSLHGSKYGEAGIAMIDRVSGQEVGEIEGGEPVMILSRNTYANNGAVIDKLLHSSLHRNGEPITMKNGGILPLKMTDTYYQKAYALGGVFTRKSYEDGGVIDLNNSASPEATAAIEENRKVSINTEKNTEETAKNTADIIEAIKASNNLLNDIKNKPSGISLHDLNSAVNRAVYSSSKSNF